MILQERISAFHDLGQYLKKIIASEVLEDNEYHSIKTKAFQCNAWFHPRFIDDMFAGISEWLQKDRLELWLESYPELQNHSTDKKIALVLAGNIPLVGFHDVLSVLISGNTALIKMSSSDNVLLKWLLEKLIDINPAFNNHIVFSDARLAGFDAVIATGSDNSSRYFDYYFNKYPAIIRGHRNSVAVLTGNESSEELESLADDVFRYFGLGCRSVSHLFVPENYDFDKLFKPFKKYEWMLEHNKYMNNVDYNRAVYMMNSLPFLEGFFILFKEDNALNSPIGVLNYSFYSDIKMVEKLIVDADSKLQCVVSEEMLPNRVLFGQAQSPMLNDYSDRIDTLGFLCNVSKA